MSSSMHCTEKCQVRLRFMISFGKRLLALTLSYYIYSAAMSNSRLLVDALTKLPSLKVLCISYRGSWNFHPPSSESVQKPINCWDIFFSAAAVPLLRTLELHVNDIKPSSLLAFLRSHPSLEAIDFHSAVQYKTYAPKGSHSDSLPQLSCLSCPINWLRCMPSSGSLTTLSLYGIINVGAHDSLLLTQEKLRPLTSIPSLKHLSIHLAPSPKSTNLITCIGSFVPELEELVIKLTRCLCTAYFLSVGSLSFNPRITYDHRVLINNCTYSGYVQHRISVLLLNLQKTFVLKTHSR